MRVLVVTNLYPPHAFGGYEDLCRGAVAAWRASGHTVHVLTSTWRRPDVPAHAPAPASEPVTRTLPIYWDDHRMLRPSPMTVARWERATRSAVDAAVDQVRPDVASVWNAGGLSMGLFGYLERREVPAVLVIGDRWLEWGDRADPWARAFTTGALRPLAGAVSHATGLATRARGPGPSVVATFASRHLLDGARRSGAHVGRAALVPHGVDLSRYPLVAPDGARPWRGRLLYVGRIAEEKGVDTAISSLQRLPGAVLRILGAADARYHDALERLAASLGVAERVEFAGEAGAQTLRREYLDADALVFPSRWEEPFGIVPLEAMACGTPVVATATGGSGEFLLDRVTSLTFAAGDAAGLAAAVTELATDGALRHRLRVAGLRVAAWLDRDRTYRDLDGWLRYVAGADAAEPEERPVLPPAYGPA